MVEATEKLFDEMESCMSEAFEAAGLEIKDIKNIGDKEFKCIKSFFRLMDSTKEHQLKQAEMIDALNKELINVSKKLDKLLNK